MASPLPVLLLLTAARPFVVDARVGPAWLTTSRSHALGHMIRPTARLGARAPLGERVELGGSAMALLVGSEHYRVLGAVAHARYALWERTTFSLGAGAGLGVGYDADILHADLEAPGRVAPYGFLAADARWTLFRRWLVGVEAAWENRAALTLGLLVGWGAPWGR
jgi:hypothetical protein